MRQRTFRRSIAIVLFIQLYIGFVFSQSTNQNFGIQFIDTITLPTADNYILNAKLRYIKPKRDYKQYYNTNDTIFERKCSKKYDTIHFEIDTSKHVVVLGKKNNNHALLIPPLKPNQYYELDVKYVNKYNIYGLFRGIHEEDIEFFKENKDWMNIAKTMNILVESFQLYYQPQVHDLEALKYDLRDFDTIKIDTLYLKNIFLNRLRILNFRKDKIEDDSYISYAKWIVKQDSFDVWSTFDFFSFFEAIPDYLAIYEFYQSRLKTKISDKELRDYNAFIDLVDTEIKDYRNELVEKYKEAYPEYILPNFLNDSSYKHLIIHSRNTRISTYPKNFETSYKSSLVPDFGYVGYIPYDGSLKGGTPYLGVHISLSPVNKDVPLSLSQLSFAQRFSIHTGFTLNSLNKEDYREDFFSNFSLLLGGGFKVVSQSTRLNFGGIVFNKLDAISGESSLAIQPYVGISIDIEIKKWLEGIIPSFKPKI